MMAWATGASYFHPDYGLKAGKLADAIADAGPLAVDPEGGFWAYASGVWRPDPGEVRRRAVRELGERFRPAHLRAVTDVLAAHLPEFTVRPVSGYINFRNGMLRWDAPGGPDLLEHHPEYHSTVQLPISWVPDAVAPAWDAFLLGTVPEDDRDRAWQVLGYLMMSGNPLQRLFMLTGSGGNGKGVYLNVARAILGEDNVSAVPLQEFSDSQFSTAELYGKLANICGDIDATFIANTARIKELSGDDQMKGERKFGHPFYFRFWGKAIFSANAIPGAADASRGWLRRWEVIQFPYEPTVPDPTLSARLTTEETLRGIAVGAVHALRVLMSAGKFAVGDSSTQAHAEFAEKSNRVIRWINDPDSNVRREDGMFNKSTILLKAFRAWEVEDAGNGNNPTGAQKFHELARQAGLQFAVKRGQRGFYGLHVADTVLVKPADRPWLNYVGRAGASAPDVHPSGAAAHHADHQIGLELG